MGCEVYHNLKNLIKAKYGERQGAESAAARLQQAGVVVPWA